MRDKKGAHSLKHLPGLRLQTAGLALLGAGALALVFVVSRGFGAFGAYGSDEGLLPAVALIGFALAAGLGWLLSGRLAQYLVTTTHLAHDVRTGASERLRAPDGASSETADLSAELNELVSTLRSQNAVLQQRSVRLGAQLASRTAEVSTLVDLTHKLSVDTDERLLYRNILDALYQSVEFRSASIWGRIPTGVVIKYYANPGHGLTRDPEDLLTVSPVYEKLYDQVLRSNQAVLTTRPRRTLMGWLAGQFSTRQSDHLLSGAISSITLPLMAGSNMQGVLYVDHTDPAFFTVERQKLLKAVGQQAALAVDRARMAAETSRAAVILERNRIARELHDAVSQHLFAISITASRMGGLVAHDPDRAGELAIDIQRLSKAASSELRMLLFELRPDALLGADLTDLLRFSAEATANRIGAELSFRANLSANPPTQIKVQLYRIAQEALSNIVRHSSARHVVLILAGNGAGACSIQIADDGNGFDPSAPSAGGHFGLENMRARAAEIGAALEINSSAEDGTRTILTWPAPAAPAKQNTPAVAQAMLPYTHG